MTVQVNPNVSEVVAPPIPEVRAWAERAAGRGEVLDVSQAVPAYPPFSGVAAHVARAAARPDAGQYTPILGLPALREGLASRLSEEYRGDVAPADIAITAGCNQAFCVALTALAGPGDEVLLPLPYYFNHDMWLRAQGVYPVHLPFVPGAPGPDLDLAARLVSSRTRALVLVTPNNPTGARYPASYLAAAGRFAARHGIALVVDETYKDFRGDAEAPHALLADAGWREHVVQLHSFSKSYALAGFRVGAVVCGARPMAAVEKILDCVAICPPRLSQEAAVFALAHAGAWHAEKVRLMVGRARALVDALGAAPLGFELLSVGAFFAYLRHPYARATSREVARRLALEHGVLCLPGSAFGPQQERYLRLAFANLEADRLPELARRLAASEKGR